MRATFALLFVVGCNVTQTGELGNLVFDDNESLSAPGNGAFVVGDELSFNAAVADSAGTFPGSVVAFSSDESVLQFDPTPGGLSFSGTVVGEGSADLEVVDAITLEIIDQISLRGAAPFAIAVGTPALFSNEDIGESFDALHMLPGDSLALLSKPTSAGGEVLKGQLFGSLEIDAAIASVSGGNVIGSQFTLTVNAIGAAELLFTTGSLSSATPVNVVSPDDAAITINIPERGTKPISQGTIIVDSILPDGNNVDGERYNIKEFCILNSANAPCHLEIEPSFTPNAAIFAAGLSGTATIVVELIDSDDVVLKTETIEIEVIAQ